MSGSNFGPVGPSRRASVGASGGWGRYWDALFPPAEVTRWQDWKRNTTGVNVARRFWAQREYLRRTYESVYGSNPEVWPSRHPGVVLDAVPIINTPPAWVATGSARAAATRCCFRAGTRRPTEHSAALAT